MSNADKIALRVLFGFLLFTSGIISGFVFSFLQFLSILLAIIGMIGWREVGLDD